MIQTHSLKDLSMTSSAILQLLLPVKTYSGNQQVHTLCAVQLACHIVRPADILRYLVLALHCLLIAGLYGQSTVRQVDLVSGTVLRQQALAASDFGEGLVKFGSRYCLSGSIELHAAGQQHDITVPAMLCWVWLDHQTVVQLQ